MGRISEAELERLKQSVRLEELVSRHGVKLERHGRELIGLCPFHDDHSPSLVVSPQKNLWHCLGACQMGGSVIDWVMKASGVSFRHAVELLRESPQALAAEGRSAKTRRELSWSAEDAAGDQELLSQVVDFYHAQLGHHAEAMAYLERRGLDDAELVRHFRIGVSDRTLTYRLPQKNRRDGGILRGRLQRVGILRESGHEHFRGCVVIPVCDGDGAVREVYGRRIGKVDSRRPRSPHLYLPGAHQGVFNEAGLGASEEVILCESLIDALTFWRHGFRAVTSSFGIQGFTDELLAALVKNGAKRVMIAYDRDDAGDKAALGALEKLKAKGIGSYRVLFPRGEDANSFAVGAGDPQGSLAAVLESAVWLGDGEDPRSLDGATMTSSAEEPSNQSAGVGVDVGLDVPVDVPAGMPVEMKAGEVVLRFGDAEGGRRWRVRGLEKNSGLDALKVNVLCGRGGAFHVDTFDLYAARGRAAFLKQAAIELEVEEKVLKRDLGRVLNKLESLHAEMLRAESQEESSEVTLSPEEREEAMALLRDPELLSRIVADFNAIGVVGEETNKLVGYLASISRKLERPLAVVIQSSSAAGKTSLMDAVLGLVPEEDRVKYSAMTGQSLFYMGELDLKHKILAIAEEAGAERASYALKLLQSEGELRIASTGKDPETGRLVTHEYHVEGPVMLMLTTTAIDVDEELLNRALVLTVNEDESQTRAIHELQRASETLEGLLTKRDGEKLRRLHQNAQRLLRPLLVANPYAKELTFLTDRTRTRRDHLKYLTLIRAVALLHQYQRPLKVAEHRGERVEYIEATLEDIRVAGELAHKVLGRSLDELPPQTRRLLERLDAFVSEECKRLEVERRAYRFTRREVRERLGFGDTQLKVHLRRFEELEYVAAHRSGRGQGFVYELLWERRGEGSGPYLPGLVDVEALEGGYDARRSGSEAPRSGARRGVVGLGADRSEAQALGLKGDLGGGGRGDGARTVQGEGQLGRRSGRKLALAAGGAG